MATPLHQQPLPEQPYEVANWIREHNKAVRQVNRIVRTAVRGGLTLADVDEIAGDFAENLADTLAKPPAHIAKAWREWADQYNAVVRARNAERQARINARNLAKLKEGTCSVCTMIHPGEC